MKKNGYPFFYFIVSQKLMYKQRKEISFFYFSFDSFNPNRFLTFERFSFYCLDIKF